MLHTSLFGALLERDYFSCYTLLSLGTSREGLLLERDTILSLEHFSRGTTPLVTHFSLWDTSREGTTSLVKYFSLWDTSREGLLSLLERDTILFGALLERDYFSC